MSLLSLSACDARDAWEQVMHALWKTTPLSAPHEAIRDVPFSLFLERSDAVEKPEHFPMTEDELRYIREHLLYGAHEDVVSHAWTKCYRKRLFDEEPQIPAIIDYLKEKPQGKRAQASLWRQSYDLRENPIAPCLQLLWFQMKGDALELHVHMRASDAYGKLFMNMDEFTALQRMVAEALGVPSGAFVLFLDSLHFYRKDAEVLTTLLEENVRK